MGNLSGGGAIAGDERLASSSLLSSASPMFLRKLAATGIGNVLEWYDFAVFGSLADVLGEVFFPGDDKSMQLLQALGVFGAAFVMRPLGGILIGIIGDKARNREQSTTD